MCTSRAVSEASAGLVEGFPSVKSPKGRGRMEKHSAMSFYLNSVAETGGKAASHRAKDDFEGRIVA